MDVHWVGDTPGSQQVSTHRALVLSQIVLRRAMTVAGTGIALLVPWLNVFLPARTLAG
jgi:hypothetical protein